MDGSAEWWVYSHQVREVRGPLNCSLVTVSLRSRLQKAAVVASESSVRVCELDGKGFSLDVGF